MTFVPSPQQNDFFKAVALGRDNLILEAVAGAGKTTTLVQACKLLSGKPALEARADAARDQLETMKVLCEKKQSLDEVRADIENLFKDTEQGDVKDVTLSTVHKSKGREWHNVFVLGFEEYMPLQAAKLPWEIAQEYNLIYVAVTRAQQRLTLIG